MSGIRKLLLDDPSSLSASSKPLRESTLASPVRVFRGLRYLGSRSSPNLELDLAVIEDPAVAEASLDPVRSRLLAELAEPASATMLAGKLGLPRQNVNYHLRALEEHGLSS